MRRIEGIALVGSGPVREGFLRLGDVTVITGRNDSGKTRLLRLIEAALNDPHVQKPDQGFESMDVFGMASEGEVAAFVHSGDFDTEEIIEQVEPFAPFRTELELEVGDGGFPLAVRTPIAGVERLPAWRYGRPPAELPDSARATIADARGSSGYIHEPSAIEYLGGVEAVVLPEAVAVPSAPALVQIEAAEAVGILCRSLRFLDSLWEMAEDHHLGPLDNLALLADALPERDGYYGPDAPWNRWMLKEAPDAVSLHPAAVKAREALELLISHLLPDFIRDAYRLEVMLPPVVSIAAGERLQLMLVATSSDSSNADELDEDETVRFPIVEAASGFAVWLQLAVREACARAKILAQILMDGAMRAEDLASVLREGDPEPSALAGAAELKLTLEHALASLVDPQGVPAELVTAGFEPIPRQTDQRLDRPATLRRDWMTAFRPRLYLLDEPEQRLHPALQRRAARWLADRMHEWRSQCLLATHSTAFMDIPGDTRVYELARSGKSASLAAIDFAELTPHAQLAREMGLDRGELLSRWRAYLFVEGLADVAVLEELFEDRLESSRIRVLPVHGHRHHAGLLDMFILAEATAVPITAMIDGISEEELKRLRTLGARERRAAMTDPGEIGTAAKILDLALKHERQIEILTIDAPDIFDLLDEDVIRRTSARTAARPFPGHVAARDAFAKTNGQHNAAAYKQFLDRAYGVQTTGRALRRVARAMRQRSLPPPPRLEEALTRVEQAALASELHLV
jgi:energy-coupling factor transporter ATP-binding protein EcfA2